MVLFDLNSLDGAAKGNEREVCRGDGGEGRWVGGLREESLGEQTRIFDA